jgi:putative ABC transport system permease protein
VMNDATRHWSVVINEAAVRALHLGNPQEAIGRSLQFSGWVTGAALPASITVIGVVPDFPVDSMRSAVEPTLFGFNPNLVRIVSIRLDGRRIPEAMQAIEALWSRLGEPRAISRWFLAQYYQRLYADVLQQRRVLGLLSAVAVLLACLGLFGLSVFIAQRRTKEIGIRKVMGASSADMMKLLLWAFTKPIFWASLAAWPIALWAMQGWLSGFVYRVDIGAWLLPVASLGALTITLLTVSAHTFAVARSKPVHALRYE